jgi:hypothetical protein
MPQPNMNQMLQQVQKMQRDMAAAQEQLKHEGAGVGRRRHGHGHGRGDLVVVDHHRPRRDRPDDADMLRTSCSPPSAGLRSAQELRRRR